MEARYLHQILFDICENGFTITIEKYNIHKTMRIMVSNSYKYVAKYITEEELKNSNIDNDLLIRMILEDLLKNMKEYVNA